MADLRLNTNCKCVVEPIFALEAKAEQARERIEKITHNLREVFYDAEVMDMLADGVDTDEGQAALTQFIADGGEPWDIYRIERAYLGADLTTLMRSRLSRNS